jgi:hypothetical protein
MPRSPGRPANDNEDPDESWRRAEIILKASSGLDLASADEERSAITQLVTDILHYCEVMSLGKRSDHPDYLDFDKLVDVAIQHYNVQSHSMNSVMEAEANRTVGLLAQRFAQIKTAQEAAQQAPAQEEDYASKYLKDTPSPDDAKLEPELQETLRKLYDRQRQELRDLFDDHLSDLQQVEDYKRTDIAELHFDDDSVAADHRGEVDTQLDHFAEERERYIGDYQKAQSIRGEMEQSREKSLEQGLDEDPPKLTR